MLRQTLTALLLLFACQLSGDVIAGALNLPVPGPVVGMLLLLVALIVRKRMPQGLAQTTAPLLRHMSLLFIPAGTGVILYVDLIAAEWLAIVGAIVISTLVALLTTAVMFRLFQSVPLPTEQMATQPTTRIISADNSEASSKQGTPQGDAHD